MTRRLIRTWVYGLGTWAVLRIEAWVNKTGRGTPA